MDFHSLLTLSNFMFIVLTFKRLDMLRREAARRHEIPKYDYHCRRLTNEEVKKRLENGENYAVRFKFERKEVHFKVITVNVYEIFAFFKIISLSFFDHNFSISSLAYAKSIVSSIVSFFLLRINFKDQIFGEITQNNNEGDFILMKTDSFPTYHLANVVDDHQMLISHVIRGSEWLSSVPKHMQLYQ